MKTLLFVLLLVSCKDQNDEQSIPHVEETAPIVIPIHSHSDLEWSAVLCDEYKLPNQNYERKYINCIKKHMAKNKIKLYSCKKAGSLMNTGSDILDHMSCPELE